VEKRALIVIVVVAAAACGGRSLLDPEDRVTIIVVDASMPDTGSDDARASDVSADAIADAGLDALDALADAPPEAMPDVGSGICPDPPLLTGNGVPRAPSWIEQLALGNEHTCLLIDGEVWCWGENHGGQLGDGTQVARARPTRVVGIDNAVVLASGPGFDVGCLAAVRGSHTCAVLNDATVKCWGSNVSGDNTWIIQSLTPFVVSGLSNATKLGVAGYSSCAVLRNGTLSCWGASAVPFPGFDGGVTSVAAGEGAFALLGDGTVWAFDEWTSQGATQFGGPRKVPSLFGIRSIAAGWGHQCALRSDGTVWCWGANFAGQLGDGTYNDSATPVQVAGITSAWAIGVGLRVSCALMNDSTAWCWGDNSVGQMGNGTVGGAQPRAAPVPGLDHNNENHGGWKHMCARRWDASVWCWGQNDKGQVGDGTTMDRAKPVEVFP
jgi:alpha-tubulin suppressor-like RCC1 family protein